MQKYPSRISPTEANFSKNSTKMFNPIAFNRDITIPVKKIIPYNAF